MGAMPDPFTPSDVAGSWLRAGCGCGRIRHSRVELLIRRFGPDARPEDPVARMHGERCGGLSMERTWASERRPVPKVPRAATA